jgi:hypothetical protein
MLLWRSDVASYIILKQGGLSDYHDSNHRRCYCVRSAASDHARDTADDAADPPRYHPDNGHHYDDYHAGCHWLYDYNHNRNRLDHPDRVADNDDDRHDHHGYNHNRDYDNDDHDNIAS